MKTKERERAETRESAFAIGDDEYSQKVTSNKSKQPPCGNGSLLVNMAIIPMSGFRVGLKACPGILGKKLFMSSQFFLV
jgi:hypothetical protein